MSQTTVIDFKEAKGQKKLTMLTAYDYSIAKILDQQVDAILVGDSLGMVMLGHKDTLSVTMEDMIRHCAAVSRACEHALLVCDLPFMSYQVTAEEACRNAGRLVAEGHAQAVKLEGGAEFVHHITAITRASIPVMGHIGLTPQAVNKLGGFKVQGKDLQTARKLIADARALDSAGVFAIVLECVPNDLATYISKQVSVPTIGIGSGANCDGQVLVWQDVFGLNTQHSPKFVKSYANLAKIIQEATAEWTKEVQAQIFPGTEHSYKIEASVLAEATKEQREMSFTEYCQLTADHEDD